MKLNKPQYVSDPLLLKVGVLDFLLIRNVPSIILSKRSIIMVLQNKLSITENCI